ncbi:MULTISPECIES: ribonuclease H [unclassified Cyanobium]|uniref:ribonuclease H family protein n=1 Tax=unclassified Cyanobium TaxID=2627006 RepID=UPI0020CB8A5E|nr:MULTISPECIES: ribonuclease H [unclassified Cyanobium]MCP9859376.1 ribonuclease HI [Cyanobium sp. Cruz-8H5]MCP9866513.1 ribonuclease HI [Cyanobium sp. Cruz-8D1]
MGDRPVLVLAAACDGACSGNPGPGGWGALLRFEDGSRRELGGAAPATTNNRMELTAALAVLEALRDLPRHPDLVLRTDSRYLIDGYEKWMAGWKRKGWRTASGGAVLNRDLWELLDAARLPGLALRHVRGHSGDPDNDRCDAIAVAYSRGQAPALAVETQPADTPEAGAEALVEKVAGADAGDRAPKSLQELLSRLELADRLAAGGYSLRAVELARLLEVPTAALEGKGDPWLWRDWLVRPLGNGSWRLERGAGGLARPQ